MCPLVARGVIFTNVTDRTKVGTEKITRKDFTVICPRAKRNVDGDECRCPGFIADELGRGSPCLVRKQSKRDF